jgi:hypothetical protein
LFKKYKEGEYEEKILNQHASEIDLTQEDETYELILEIGFSIYNLMQMFLANKKGKVVIFLFNS